MIKNSTRLILFNRQLWTPANISGALALWLDAADFSTIVLNGSTASGWRDKSINKYIFSQPTVANQPTYTTNGIAFDGNKWFNSVSISLTNFSVMMVETQTQNSSTIYYPISFSSSGSGLSVGGTFVTQRFGMFVAGSPSGLLTTEQSTLNAPFIVFGGSSSMVRQISVNGNNPVADNEVQSVNNFTIGRRGDGVWPFVGIISEIVATNTLLSTTDRQRLEGYFAHKWRLTANLPNNHPFKFTAPRT